MYAIHLLLLFFLCFVFVDSFENLKAYGCYVLKGGIDNALTLPRTITPISSDNLSSTDVHIVCVSMVKGGAFRHGNLKVGDKFDLTNIEHEANIFIPKPLVETGIYGSDSGYLIIPTCKLALIKVMAPTTLRLQIGSPFFIAQCINIEPPQSKHTKDPEDSFILGANISFRDKPFECRFDNSFDGHKHPIVFWTCYSRVNELVVTEMTDKVTVTEREVIAMAKDNGSMQGKIAIEALCSGTITLRSHGKISKNKEFLQIRCSDETHIRGALIKDLTKKQSN
ncbi:uncharacterized protein CMU_017480 [Cryptosporidium muris RN66]|uniref:Uncharacterized protein n=1 Tax=Cryptosporidium muris (strain RN66) TaxID=441375 RepID=B6ACZ1_CRYMR|nr:uncharacterized protein CMU_017480 [Cryptosporidium muris RN66]EEA05995.1 hypothetical protein, conserved [Cryptosporidium muris RN66]|eukprot:XP_002140344.1 hypothetical protein [Cryptosporidium muris RN66]